MNVRTGIVGFAPAAAASLLLAWNTPATGAGDPARGAKVFQACVACHSTAPGEHLTGPSLANVWRRRAGTVEGFDRYSDAMKRSDVTWTGPTLEKWLASPQSVIPGTSMTFPGLRDSKNREDVIAYLEAASEGKLSHSQQGGDMTTGMRGSRMDLKKAPAQAQVVAIDHCKDAYTIRTADGRVDKAWEFNLRFKTDSGVLGPQMGKPVIVGAGMQGDRASVVFAAPGEISAFIKESCP